MRHLLRRRLERCGAELIDPRAAHLTMSDIAFRWGFNNLSHFSRAFKAKFDLAPRDWRRGSGGGLPLGLDMPFDAPAPQSPGGRPPQSCGFFLSMPCKHCGSLEQARPAREC